MNKAPAFQHYAKDFLAETSFFTNEEIGVLMRLKSHYWIHGNLPNDTKKLAKLCHISARKFERIFNEKLSKLFQKNGKTLIDFELDLQREFQEEKRRKAAESANKRWGNNANAYANASETDMRTDMLERCTATAKSTESLQRRTNSSVETKDQSSFPDKEKFKTKLEHSERGTRAREGNANVSEKTETAPEKKATRIPENFAVSDDLKAWAKEFNIPEGINLAEATEKFKNHYKAAKGEKALSPDWNSIWKNWMLEEKNRFLSNVEGARAGNGKLSNIEESKRAAERYLAKHAQSSEKELIN